MRYRTIASRIKNRPDIVSLLNDSNENIDTLFELPSDLPASRVELYKKLYKGIGNSPYYTVNLPNRNILRIKMEYANPMGNNHYSRCWIPYLFIAESLGIIVPGETHLIEVTSGSSGISLAMAAQLLNYQLTLVVPENLPSGRIDPMQHYGAKLIKVPGYIGECIRVIGEELAKGNYFPCNHSEEKADILVKIYKRIAAEYCTAFGSPDYAITGLGNGTSTLAIFEYIKSISQSSKLIAFHPDLEEPDLVFGLYAANIVLRHVEPALSLADEKVLTNGIDLDEIITNFRYDTEIKNLGVSSLYAIGVAMKLAEQTKGKSFFTLGYDKNDRYII